MTLETLGSPRRHPRRLQLHWIMVCAGLVLGCALPASGQMVINAVDRLSFDRPESWALKYFTAATLFGGLEAPRSRTPGSISIGLEAGVLPPLSSAQQLVGYNGTEAQDLNKTPLFPRSRVTVGLPAHLSTVVGVARPIPMFGLTTKLFAFAVERPIHEASTLVVGARMFGQLGSVKGSYTCPASTVALAPGSPGHADGCQAASADTATLRYGGGEIRVAYRPDAVRRLSPHAALDVAYMDVGFLVDALTFGMIDHTHYLSRGTAVSASGGFSYRTTSKLTVGMDVFYAPLSVRRAFGTPSQNDGLLNVRMIASYQVR